MTQSALVLIKPDGVRRKMVGQIVGAIESLGFSIVHLEQKRLSINEATSLYEEHKGKWHFARNIKHITSGPVVVMHIRGEDAIARCRQMVTGIRDAHKEVIKLPKNIVHSTSDPERSEKELESVGCPL
jgi:nucleoside-diphosphate kinase